MSTLYHLVPLCEWDECKQSRQSYFPPTFHQDGFIHMTKEPKLLLTVANHFYTDVKGEYVVLAVDSTKLTSAVKFEPAADVGNKKSDGLVEGDAEPVLFPHLYGTIDFDAVTGELPVVRAAEGAFLSITGLAEE